MNKNEYAIKVNELKVCIQQEREDIEEVNPEQTIITLENNLAQNKNILAECRGKMIRTEIFDVFEKKNMCRVNDKYIELYDFSSPKKWGN